MQWDRISGSTSAFMFAQGWLVASAVTHPEASFPIITRAIASTLRLYNLTMWGALVLLGMAIKDGVWAASQLAPQITGEPSFQTMALIIM